MEDAELYAISSAMQKRDASAAMATFIGEMEIKPGERILDIGCGTGEITRGLLAEWLSSASEIVGVDISWTMIEFARKFCTFPNLNGPNVVYKQMDIERTIEPRMLFPEGFDKIFSFYCLHWTTDLRQVLDNIYDLLKPGGETFLVFLAQNPIFTMYELMSYKPDWKEYMKDVSNFVPRTHYLKNPAEYFAQMALESKFDVRSCSTIEKSFLFENINHVRNAVRAVNPFTQRIPPALQEFFIQDCLQTLQEITGPAKNGKMTANYKLMTAHFRKTALSP
ncbi:juvenile hormone acid O-methyltransferase-like isoform X2 [Artemia franciscana]|uniref:Methyltransferase domain-containing protein n=1 Tax=Artemia franciscana TaxID=6661 RepID=A0AA88I5Y7_ARTSF|nr:hypothetical protein QYM36_004656 [Artemia franciscana]